MTVKTPILKVSRRAVGVVTALALLSPQVFALFNPAPAAADPTVVTYPVPHSEAAKGITQGPDGAVWVVSADDSSVSRVTVSGSSTYAIPSPYGETAGIAAGSDGALWFTEVNKDKIGRITTDGVVTNEFSVPLNSYPYDITAGSDGALWFTNVGNDTIGRMSNAGVYTSYPILNQHSGRYGMSSPYGITSGPDGALWFTEALANKIGRMTTSGVATDYTIPTANSYPVDITTGSDGALWFTERDSDKIGRITTSGTITEYTLSSYFSGSGPWKITAAPDGNIWFTTYDGLPGSITTSGVSTLQNFAGFPRSMVAGADNALWFTSGSDNYIGRVSGLILTAPTNLTTTATPTKNAPALTWTASDGATSYNVYRNGTKIGSSTTPSYTDSTAPEGVLSYTVTAVNASGESIASNGVTVVVDRTRPVMSFTAPSSFSTTFTTGPTVSVSAADPGSGLQILAIHVYTSSNQLLTTCGTATPTQLAAGSMSCSLASLPNGTYYIKAGSFDNAGNNQTINSGNFTIQR